MGKGQFLTEMAARHPERNYIGIERYSSVLLRAVERLDKLEEEKKSEQEGAPVSWKIYGLSAWMRQRSGIF